MEFSNDISKKLYALNFLLLVAIVVVIFAISNEDRKPKVVQAEEIVEELPVFGEVALTAKSAYVLDVKNDRVLYKKNEFVQLPLASITKMMMALTASELLAKDSKITIKEEFLGEEGDNGLLVNESWKLKDLLDFSLVVSSNDGARSIASVIGATKLNTEDYDLGRKEFVKEMNLKAQILGLKQTYFVNESGLDVGEVSGGYGSAIDISNLLKYILANKPEILEATKYKSITINSENKNHIAKNTNTEVATVPGLIASKTGFTDLAGGNLAIAFDASMERPIVVVVLGSTQEGRFKDIEKLVKASQEYVSK